MRLEDGSSLSVAGHVRWTPELQGLSPLFDLHFSFLLGMLCDGRYLGLGRGAERHLLCGYIDAG